MAKKQNYKVGIEGADEVVKMLADMGQSAEDVLEKAAEAGGKIALNDAKRRCPVKTIRLKNSLYLEKLKKSQGKADVKVSIGKKEFYGVFVELGTGDTQAKPYLRPAVDENKDKISKAVNESILKAIGRHL